MNTPILDVQSEFDLMADYQIVIESKCVVVVNSPKDSFRYSLVTIVEPIPSYIEYLNGHDFEECEIIMNSNNVAQLIALQNTFRPHALL